jgi:hypothetical protein
METEWRPSCWHYVFELSLSPSLKSGHLGMQAVYTLRKLKQVDTLQLAKS